MLRSVRLKNFIKFEEDQFLQFKDEGVHLFVGENSSGKSAVLEAIRRCMDMKSNCSFIINFPNKEKPAYVICDFFLPQNVRQHFSNYNRIVTSFVYIPSNHPAIGSSKGTGIAAKVVLTTSEEGQNEDISLDIIQSSNLVGPASNISCQLMENDKSALIKELKELPRIKNMSSEQFLKTVNQIIERNTMSQQTASSDMNEDNTLTESVLSALGEHVVSTFALRAVGRVQWSKSPNLRNGEENYSMASERCEIIRWFKDKRYDISKAEEIFKTLTGGEDFEFKFEQVGEKELLQVVDGSGDKFSILKCPEGILEAKHISLLLSYESFVTIILEEADHGMHPQMIQRLRDIVLAAEKNKTIIIVSHNAAFISPMLLSRTFKFSKISNSNTGNSVSNDRFHIANVGNVLDTIKNAGEPIPRVASEKYANVLFAKRVLFVEGESDWIFIRTMFMHILNPKTEQSAQHIFELISKQHKLIHNADLEANWHKKLKDLLTTLHVLNMEGHGNKDKWHRFCEETKTPHIFLLDADTVATANISQQAHTFLANQLALDIHTNFIKLLTDKKIKSDYAKRIADFLREKFLKENSSIDQCKEFIDQEINRNINIISQIQAENTDQENVDMGKLFGEIDAKLYGKVIQDKIEKLTIPQPNECQWIRNEKFLKKSKIISDTVRETFQQHLETDAWIQARDTLKRERIFVWKDGCLEDAILGIILATETENPVERTYGIFRKYLSFFLLKIDLPLESFHKQRSQKHKLYCEKSGITNEDIQSSIERVFKFCLEDSDIVQFLHFLTMCSI